MRFISWPFVKKRLYRRCKAERDAALAAKLELDAELQYVQSALINLPGSLANCARFLWLKSPSSVRASSELCLFVTHMATPQIKLHVVDHVRALSAMGIAVVLIMNTDLDPDGIQLPSELAADLHACIVRENTGFDFAAWAHVYSLLDADRVVRLYLVNDSIVGPLDATTFASMIDRIRLSTADVVGLTSNPHPRWHLQSYFLVINRNLLPTRTFTDLMRYVVNLPTKEAVINTYEIQLSSHLMARDFTCEPVFSHLEPCSALPDDTLFRWSELIEHGFPYIKASVLRRVKDLPKAVELVHEKYRIAAQVEVSKQSNRAARTAG